MGVYLQGKNWATQGPAPDGFHVPLTTERQAVYDIRTALGGGSSAGTDFGKALKLPFAGFRNSNDSNVSRQGTFGYYWSSSPSPSDADSSYNLLFNSSIVYPQYSNYRAYGFSVRCFKNSPVVPTSSWTKLYGTNIESGGIFWNSSKGLISLSSNGQTWITIADKNLGATTVWNSGNTLSQANCGNYYQRGNNYGFPRTGTIANQSTTQVDASSYCPGNYYSSDTFIKYNGRWDTTDNGNLRGGVDGNVPTMSELKNAYIGEYVLINTPGIYHNATLGLISLSSDGENWLTIADKNLGATSTDVTSSNSYGKYYQPGNNYGWSSAPSSTVTTQVNAGSYGPNNYYSSSTFVKDPNHAFTGWDSSNNNNLWGGTTGTFVARKGPCDSGYHVPSRDDWDNIISIGTSLGAFTTANPSGLINYLKMPVAGNIRGASGTITLNNYRGWYIGSQLYSGYSYGIYFNDASYIDKGNMSSQEGGSIRPFKNEAVQPDGSRTKLY